VAIRAGDDARRDGRDLGMMGVATREPN